MMKTDALIRTSNVKYPIRFSYFLVAICFSASAAQSATNEEFPVVRATTKSQGAIVGDLLNETEKDVVIFDYVSNRSITIVKSNIGRLENPVTLDDAAGYVGLSAVMGRKISVLSERKISTGKIAKVSPQIVYLTLGESSGVVVGQKVSVFRGEGQIVDPDTGDVLASERARIAELEISEVSSRVSKARLVGDLEVKLEVGDEVEPQGNKLIVAVCPLSNDDGSANPTGISIAEELVSALVQRKVNVVERSSLDVVLSELIAQNTVLFDPKSAQQLGELTGASMVLTGKIIQEKSPGKAHLRLINVKTGEIVLAITTPVKLTARSSNSTNATATRSTSSGTKSGSASVSKGRDELEYLGKSKTLPKYLTTSAALERGTESGVRFLGFPKHYDFEAGIILTRDRNFLDRNFIFDVLLTFGPNDGVTHIGIGSGRQDGSANKRAESVFVRFHSPTHGDGGVSLQGSEKPEVVFGNVRQKGVHLLRITKEGDSVTFMVDPENDGPTDDDFETVVPDLREYAPYLNNKNSTLFLGGTGTIVATRLKELP